jgi:hypothetical protein
LIRSIKIPGRFDLLGDYAALALTLAEIRLPICRVDAPLQTAGEQSLIQAGVATNDLFPLHWTDYLGPHRTDTASRRPLGA